MIPSHDIPRVGRIYNTRYYLLGGDGEGRAKGWRGRCKWNIFLHHFQSSDGTQELHNHPYGFSFSIILKGGYTEERLQDDGSILTRFLGPGTINVIRRGTYHRIQLRDEEHGCWTLFFAGKKVGKWGFLDRNTWQYRNSSGET